MTANEIIPNNFRIQRARAISIGLVSLLAWSSGCGDSPGAEANLDMTFTGYHSQFVTPRASGANGVSPDGRFKAMQILNGQMMITNVADSNDVTVHDWAVFLDDQTWVATSNKTIVIQPGTYDFDLLVSKADQQYAGSVASYTVDDAGLHDIPLTLFPVIGDTAIEVGAVGEQPWFKLQYDPVELSGLADPQMGVRVDGGAEQIFALNATTGISDTYLSLSPGSHEVQLTISDGNVLKGRSVPAQEDVFITGGQDLTMDVIPLHGDAAFSLTEDGGDATFTFTIPAAVVDEAGGASNLEARFSMVGDDNPLQEGLLTLAPAGSDYTAAMTLSDVQFGEVVLSLAFYDASVNPNDLLGSCDMAVVLNSQAGAESCDISLVRRAVLGGSLLAALGINVLNELGEPIAGAVTSANGDVIGITGSGAFGTPGYLKAYLSADTYTLRAEDAQSQMFGEVQVSPSPLQVMNIDIALDTPLDTTAPTVTIDAGPADPSSVDSASFEFSADESGVAFECSLDGGPYVACSAPQAYSGLADGFHTFQVRGTDQAGNAAESNAYSWNLVISALNGSCKAILDAGQSVGDGVYTLDPDGAGGAAPFDAYCDMTDGGWTLVMKAEAGSSTFLYNASYWTDTQTLNAGDLTTAAGDAKYPSYFSVPGTELRGLRELTSETFIMTFDSSYTLLDIIQNSHQPSGFSDVYGNQSCVQTRNRGVNRSVMSSSLSLTARLSFDLWVAVNGCWGNVNGFTVGNLECGAATGIGDIVRYPNSSYYCSDSTNEPDVLIYIR